MWLEAMERQLIQAHLQCIVIKMIGSRNDAIERSMQSVRSSHAFTLVNRCKLHSEY
jgi:hypothetical protein